MAKKSGEEEKECGESLVQALEPRARLRLIDHRIQESKEEELRSRRESARRKRRRAVRYNEYSGRIESALSFSTTKNVKAIVTVRKKKIEWCLEVQIR